MKRKFLVPIATIISALATETSNGKSMTEIGTDLTGEHYSYSVDSTNEQKTPFVLLRSEDSFFIAAHRSHSSHSSHSSHYSGSSGYGSTYSPPKYSSPNSGSHGGYGSTYSPSISYPKYSPEDLPSKSINDKTTLQNLDSKTQENYTQCTNEVLDSGESNQIKMLELRASCFEKKNTEQ